MPRLSDCLGSPECVEGAFRELRTEGVLGSSRRAFAGGIMTQARSRTGEAMASHPLVGTWRLVSWENRSAVDGRVSYPLGRDVVGYIMYGDDGHVSVAISRPDRAKFATEDLLGGEAQERAQTAGTYVSYCGRHEFRGHGHPPRGTQPIPKLGRRCAGTPRRS